MRRVLATTRKNAVIGGDQRKPSPEAIFRTSSDTEPSEGHMPLGSWPNAARNSPSPSKSAPQHRPDTGTASGVARREPDVDAVRAAQADPFVPECSPRTTPGTSVLTAYQFIQARQRGSARSATASGCGRCSARRTASRSRSSTAQPRRPPSRIERKDESDPGPYRLPDDAAIDGDDGRVLVVDRDRCLLVELRGAEKTGPAAWKATAGALFDLGSNDLRPDGWRSADPSGLPIYPGLARFEEIERGEITHALRRRSPIATSGRRDMAGQMWATMLLCRQPAPVPAALHRQSCRLLAASPG